MAEHHDNTEKPTEKRLTEAHKRGQFARAPEIQVVAGLLASFLVILIFSKTQAVQVAEFSVSLFGHLEKIDLKPEGVPEWTQHGVLMLLGLGMPMMAGCAVAGVLAGGFQTRFRLTPDVFEAKLDRLNPVRGFANIFSKTGAVRLAVDTAKFALVGVLIYGGIREILSDPLFYTPVPIHQLGGFIYNTSLTLLFRLALAMAGLALLHFLYQRTKTEKDLMMSRQEVKEEMRDANGDPVVKTAQRRMARRLMQRQMLAAVSTADVVVTNPTHYAVALKYERGKDKAPVVLAKGESAFARRIKALAVEHGVPMVENKPIARALFKYGKVGEAIPTQLYRAVAEILGFVYRTHRYYFHQLKARRLSA